MSFYTCLPRGTRVWLYRWCIVIVVCCLTCENPDKNSGDPSDDNKQTGHPHGNEDELNSESEDEDEETAEDSNSTPDASGNAKNDQQEEEEAKAITEAFRVLAKDESKKEVFEYLTRKLQSTHSLYYTPSQNFLQAGSNALNKELFQDIFVNVFNLKGFNRPDAAEWLLEQGWVDVSKPNTRGEHPAELLLETLLARLKDSNTYKMYSFLFDTSDSVGTTLQKFESLSKILLDKKVAPLTPEKIKASVDTIKKLTKGGGEGYEGYTYTISNHYKSAVEFLMKLGAKREDFSEYKFAWEENN